MTELEHLAGEDPEMLADKPPFGRCLMQVCVFWGSVFMLVSLLAWGL